MLALLSSDVGVAMFLFATIVRYCKVEIRVYIYQWHDFTEDVVNARVDEPMVQPSQTRSVAS